MRLHQTSGHICGKGITCMQKSWTGVTDVHSICIAMSDNRKTFRWRTTLTLSKKQNFAMCFAKLKMSFLKMSSWVLSPQYSNTDVFWRSQSSSENPLLFIFRITQLKKPFLRLNWLTDLWSLVFEHNYVFTSKLTSQNTCISDLYHLFVTVETPLLLLRFAAYVSWMGLSGQGLLFVWTKAIFWSSSRCLPICSRHRWSMRKQS